jgi:hypothetical protein
MLRTFRGRHTKTLIARKDVPFELDERFIVAAEHALGASLPYSYR